MLPFVTPFTDGVDGNSTGNFPSMDKKHHFSWVNHHFEWVNSPSTPSGWHLEESRQSRFRQDLRSDPVKRMSQGHRSVEVYEGYKK